DRLMPLLDFLIPQYSGEGKSHLMVAIGCTGGRHRSVVIAEDLAARYGENEQVFVEAIHRDIDKQTPGA
ncbi:MAG: RNase adapter RapZ, partial [Solirubrobacteraceae bacterium]